MNNTTFPNDSTPDHEIEYQDDQAQEADNLIIEKFAEQEIEQKTPYGF